jgi:hypothetical protein
VFGDILDRFVRVEELFCFLLKVVAGMLFYRDQKESGHAAKEEDYPAIIAVCKDVCKAVNDN